MAIVPNDLVSKSSSRLASSSFPKGVPKKSCSENMQQIYRRAPMLKYDFNKVASNKVASKFAAYFQNTFY